MDRQLRLLPCFEVSPPVLWQHYFCIEKFCWPSGKMLRFLSFFLAPSPLVLQSLIAIKIKLNKTQEAISVKCLGSKGLVPLSQHRKTTSVFLPVLVMFS